MGPRPFGRGMLGLSGYLKPAAKASMGPRPFGRGMDRQRAKRMPQRHRASMGPRPFGRGMYVYAASMRTTISSFNGAATFRSRNALVHVVNHQQAIASMGPRPFGRGMRMLSTAKLMPRRGASMGPRPFGRGMLMSSWIRSMLTQLLQWGRDLSVAECNGMISRKEGEELLQWGRDLSVAEWRPPWGPRRTP